MLENLLSIPLTIMFSCIIVQSCDFYLIIHLVHQLHCKLPEDRNQVLVFLYPIFL